MAKKGQKFKQWTAEEKYKIIEPVLNMEKSTWDITREKGIEGLNNQKKPGNPLSKYQNKKNLTKEEQLEYENMKLRIENELLKKGYLMKGDGTIVKFTK